MTRLCRLLSVAVGAVTIAGCNTLSTQTPVEKAGFEIYILSSDEHLEQNTSSSWCDGVEDLLVSMDDIARYQEMGHRIQLTKPAAARLSDMALPGSPFAVCVDHEPVYSGEFMALYMSRSSDGVVIIWPSIEDGGDILAIQLGYPGPDFYGGEDPRSDPRILDTLRRANKLE